VIALEISSRNARVAALQKRWDRLRAGLDLILDQRGADMADLPGGARGLLVRDYKGKEADRLVTRIDPGVVSLVAELRGHERQTARNWASGSTSSRSARWSTPRRRRLRWRCSLLRRSLRTWRRGRWNWSEAGAGVPPGMASYSPMILISARFLRPPSNSP